MFSFGIRPDHLIISPVIPEKPLLKLAYGKVAYNALRDFVPFERILENTRLPYVLLPDDYGRFVSPKKIHLFH